MDLFLDETPITKVAAPHARLSENANDWQSEIVNEAHKQNPFLGEYRVRVVMKELDPEKRYALGGLEVTNNTAVNPRDEDARQMNRATIPIVVKEGRLAPLDIFVSNKRAWPLTKDRLRMALFRPATFEVARRGGEDGSLVSTLMPPDRDGGGFGKAASSSLLDRVAGTLNREDYVRFEKVMADNVTVWPEMRKNAGVLAFVRDLGSPPDAVGESMLSKAAHAVKPTVVQVSKVGGSFKVKYANPAALAAQELELSRPEAVATVGQDVVRTVENGDTVTVSTDVAKKESLFDAEISTIDTWGLYRVKTVDGRELVGWVFPRVVDLDGVQLPQAVFSNGSESALQEQIAGSLVGKETALIDEPPKGLGVFYLARQGSAVALVPVEVHHEGEDPGGVKVFHCSTIMGENVALYPTSDIKSVSQLATGKYAIPDDMGFIPLRGDTKLVESPDGFIKQAEVNDIGRQLHIICDGRSFSFKGPAVVKLAQVLPTEWVNADEAIFNLVVLGNTPNKAREKLAEVRRCHEIWDVGTPPILLAERLTRAKTAARKKMWSFPTKLPFMVKFAAMVQDPVAVDHILSLGFLNPENVDIFLDAIPELENTLSRLCELLFASRVGLSVDDSSLERGVVHLNRVITELKALANSPDA